MAALSPNFDPTFEDGGAPAAGYLLHTYATGTTTPLVTYQDQAGTIPNTNPIVLDAAGRAKLWLVGTDEYRLHLKTPLGATVGGYPIDDVAGVSTAIENSALDVALRADLASTASGKGASTLGINDAGGYFASTNTEGALQDLGRSRSNIRFNAKHYGVTGDGVTDDTAAIQALANLIPDVGWEIEFPPGTYKCNAAQITLKPNTLICGAGRMSTVFTSTLNTYLFTVSAPVGENFSFGMSDLKVNAKFGLSINPGTFDGGRPLVMPRFTRVFFLGTYEGVGDSLYQTHLVRNIFGTTGSSLTGDNIDATQTYNDISSFGVGVFAQCLFDAKFEQCHFVHCGVGASLNGCDINVFDDCRFHQNGWHYYESRTGTGTYGSQNKLIHCDILQNYRAGGVVLNGTKYSRIIGNYFENNGPWGCYFWLADTESCRVLLNRFDDSNYYSNLPAFAIVQNPLICNVIEQNDFQSYSSSQNPTSVIRNMGYVAQDSNHPTLLTHQNNSVFFPRFRDIVPGHTRGPIDTQLYDPTNIPRLMLGNIAPISVFDSTGGASGFSFYNAANSAESCAFELKDAATVLYNLQISARAASGTTIFFTVIHADAGGATRATLSSGTVSGFTAAGYATVNQILTLSANQLAQGDLITVTWISNSAYIRGLRISPRIA